VDLFEGFGRRLVITTATADARTVAAAEEVARMLREAKIGAEVQLEEATIFFGETLDRGTWDVAAWELSGAPGLASAIDLLSLFDPGGAPPVGDNYQRWGVGGDDAAADRFAGLLARLRATVDRAEAERLLVQAEALLADEVVVIPLVVHEEVGAAWWADEITGLRVNPAGGIAWNAEAWRRVDT
jgi:ABC-type transport system substrate-binding protein